MSRVTSELSPPVTSSQYELALYNAAAYNTWLLRDRRRRIPCFERQTQRKHVECTMAYTVAARRYDKREGYIYSYPEKQPRLQKSENIFDYDMPYGPPTSFHIRPDLYVDADQAVIIAEDIDANFTTPNYLKEYNQRVSPQVPLSLPNNLLAYNGSEIRSQILLGRSVKRRPGRPGRLLPSVSSLHHCQHCDATYRTKGGLLYHLKHKHRGCGSVPSAVPASLSTVTASSTPPVCQNSTASSDYFSHSTDVEQVSCEASPQSPQHDATSAVTSSLLEGETSNSITEKECFVHICDSSSSPNVCNGFYFNNNNNPKDNADDNVEADAQAAITNDVYEKTDIDEDEDNIKLSVYRTYKNQQRKQSSGRDNMKKRRSKKSKGQRRNKDVVDDVALVQRMFIIEKCNENNGVSSDTDSYNLQGDD